MDFSKRLLQAITSCSPIQIDTRPVSRVFFQYDIVAVREYKAPGIGWSVMLGERPLSCQNEPAVDTIAALIRIGATEVNLALEHRRTGRICYHTFPTTDLYPALCSTHS